MHRVHDPVNNRYRFKDREGECPLCAIKHTSVDEIWTNARGLDVARVSSFVQLMANRLVQAERSGFASSIVREHGNSSEGSHRHDVQYVTALLFDHAWQELLHCVEVSKRIDSESALDHLI